MITKKKISDDVYVHSGFYHQLHTNNVYDNIVSKVNEILIENPDYEVFVTGHSLGAALSTLFGYEFSGERFDCGNKLGFIEANVKFGLNDKSITSDLRGILRNI